VSAHELQRLLADRSALLVDARAPERYEGRVEPIDPVAGQSRRGEPLWQANLATAASSRRHSCAPSTSGCSPAARRRSWWPVRLRRHACHHLLAMHVAGLSGARLYAGSWSEWIADTSRPVATGAQP